MKWNRVFVVFGCLAASMAGCHLPAPDREDHVQVSVEGGGKFPGSLAGSWKASQHGWEFQVEPDGRISAATIALGRVRVVPGRTTTMPTRSGQEAVFTPGQWMVHYAPGTRELTIKITMDHVRVELAGNILEGSSTDVFVGPVSAADGVWQAQWTTFTRYTAHTPQNTSFDLSTDPTYGETKLLTFERTGSAGPQQTH